ncbi:sugar phosphate nucleotidyltransferase [uncultured Fusobacterium sp.]|uniref:mannose-1-phosphate guanylyltransferase n=1 Tax=uncultured Fusobacterium sp. TaxID=159267 RepID=UPI0027DE8DEA|nr:sugar phosphate nucleotidyltransferase [uncultured Fusobacterium sp.]
MLTAIIMAGGSGERFWPLSTPERPKQLLKIFSDKTMIRETVDRILPIIEAENIFIATNIIQAKEIEKELSDIPKENIIIEPAFKDTAAAIGYSSLIIENRFKNRLKDGEKLEVVVLASDHLIKEEEEFRKVILIASKEAKENGMIVTLGIKPDKPETGYGYIEVKDDEIELNSICKVKRFREKPSQELAESYLASGKYLWNSGMFIFTTDTIFKNFEVLMEEHSSVFKEIEKEFKENLTGEELSNKVKKYFDKFEKISIDFGIMEYSKNIRVIPVDIGWNDIGSFNAFDEIFEKDENGNVVRGKEIRELDSRNNIVISDDLNISLLGIENLVIVKDKNNLLISKKNRVQDIKKILKLRKGIL